MGVNPLLPKLLTFVVIRVSPRHDKEAVGESWSFPSTEHLLITEEGQPLLEPLLLADINADITLH